MRGTYIYKEVFLRLFIIVSLAPSPTPWCSSYRKGSLRVTLDYGRQLYLLYDAVDDNITPESFRKNETHKILWDFETETDYQLTEDLADC